MGCDIHMFAEKKVKTSSYVSYFNGKKQKFKPFWSQIKDSFKNPYFDPTEPLSEYNLPQSDEPYQGRNYTLFSFLADVRNYHEIKPLSAPRGVPKDLSEGIKEEVEKWDGDGHSHSYFTLEELDKVEWSKTIVKQEGLVDPENYKIFKKTGRPSEWCGGTTNKDYKNIKWNVSLSEFCDEFCHDALGDLRNLAGREKLKPKDIRIVFWFDN